MNIKMFPRSTLRVFSTCSCNFKSILQENPSNNILTNHEKPENWDTALPFESIPGPKYYGILSKIINYVMTQLDDNLAVTSAEQLRRQYGPIVKVQKMQNNKDIVMLFDANYAQHMFRNEGFWPTRDTLFCMVEYKKSRPEWFGDATGLVTENGKPWAKIRTTINPILMQPRVTIPYTSSMDSVAQEFIKRMKDFAKMDANNQMPKDFINEIKKWALESTCLVAIGKRLGCLDPKPVPEIQKFIDSAHHIFNLGYKLDYTLSLHKIFPTPNFKKFTNSFDYLCRTIIHHLNEAEEGFKTSTEKPEPEKSVVEKLLKIDKQIAFNVAVEMLLGGIDTTSNTLGAALYYLAKFPKAQETLRKEMMELLPTKDSPVTKEVLNRAKYLKAVIKEVQRLAPVGLGILRQMQKDIVIGGFQIPKDTDIIYFNVVLCLNDYPKAKEFIPDRWLRTTDGELSHKNMSAFCSLPFGFGPRSCVGKSVAQLELQTLIAKVIRNFKLEWHHEDMTFKTKLLYGIGDPLQVTVLDIEE